MLWVSNMTSRQRPQFAFWCDWLTAKAIRRHPTESVRSRSTSPKFAFPFDLRRRDIMPSFTLETNPKVTAAKQNALIAFQQWRAEVNPGNAETLWTAVESALHHNYKGP